MDPDPPSAPPGVFLRAMAHALNPANEPTERIRQLVPEIMIEGHSSDDHVEDTDESYDHRADDSDASCDADDAEERWAGHDLEDSDSLDRADPGDGD